MQNLEFSIEVYNFLLIFCRVGGTIKFLPVLGENFFPNHIKVAFTLAISLLIYPLVNQQIFVTQQSTAFIKFIIQETFIGIFLGLTVRLTFSAIQTAAIFIATQSGLAFAMIYDPTQREQTTTINALLTMMVSTAILVSDTHHLFIKSIIYSYEIFNFSNAFNIAEFSQAITTTIGLMLRIAFQISAPFFTVHLLITICNGILARLMPSFQVFFVMTPLQVLISYMIILYTMNSTIDILLNAVNKAIITL